MTFTTSTVNRPTPIGNANNVVAGIPVNATFTAAAESGNERDVTIQLTDAAGNNIARICHFLLGVSSTADGLTPESASGTLSIADGGAGGLYELATDNAAAIVTDATGQAVVTLTQTSGADTFYLVAFLAQGAVEVSGAITFA